MDIIDYILFVLISLAVLYVIHLIYYSDSFDIDEKIDDKSFREINKESYDSVMENLKNL